MNNQTKQVNIVNTRMETNDTTTLFLEKDASGFFDYIPGQYITVYIPELGHNEGKAYSITSKPTDPFISITVKDIGTYSHFLCTRTASDVLTIGKPYGFFYPEESKEIILVAAGIGIAPLYSIMQTYKSTCSLWYSAKKIDQLVFKNEIEALAQEKKWPNIYLHTTQEHALPSIALNDRIQPKTIAQYYTDHPNSDIFICGSISFVRDMWSGLKANGVPVEHMFTESFF